MEGVGLTLLGLTLLGGLGTLLWRRHRRQQLPLTGQDVRCPLHNWPATVTVRTDPRAHGDRRHVDIAACSLLSDAAVALPEHAGYLSEWPTYKVCLETAPAHPVYTAGVSCARPCLAVLNAAAPSVPPHPLACASGASDGIDLTRQADGRSTASRLLWYASI